MILQGRNLIISAGGQVIGASRSCDINIHCESIPIASATNGQWREFLAGRKEWSVTTNSLLPFLIKPSHTFEAIGTCWDQGSPKNAKINVDGNVQVYNNRGLTVSAYQFNNGQIVLNGTWTFDTYSDPTDTSLMSLLNYVANGTIVVIVSYDAMSLNDTIMNALNYYIGVPLADMVSIGAQRSSFACIGIKGGSGQAMMNLQEGSTSHVKLFTNATGNAITDTPLKNMLLKTGTMVSLSMRIDGLPLDRVEGTALCEQARATGTVENLIQGSFSWKGSGALT